MKVLLSIILFITLAACQVENKSPENEAAKDPNVGTARTQRVEQTAPQAPMNQSPQATAERLVELATRVKKVNDATAVVFGKIAIVGIDVNADLDRPEVDVIKYSVAESLKEDPKGANALVTSDPDIVQRLREIAADIRRGKPVSGFAEELGDIVGRIMPQFPRETRVRENAPEEESDQNLRKDRPGNNEIKGNK